MDSASLEAFNKMVDVTPRDTDSRHGEDGLTVRLGDLRGIFYLCFYDSINCVFGRRLLREEAGFWKAKNHRIESQNH